MKNILKLGISISVLSLLASCSQAQTGTETTENASVLPVVQEELLAPVATTEFLERIASDSPERGWTQTRIEQLVLELEALAHHGLNPDHYHIEQLRNLSGDQQAQIATDAWLSASAHIVYGKLDAKTYEPDWTAAGRKLDLAQLLAEILDGGSIKGSLENLSPQTFQYKALKQELESLMKASEDAPGIKVEASELLKIGAKGKTIQAMKERLASLGYLLPEQVSENFDEATKLALIAFQNDNNLDADGAAGAGTLRALNRGQSERMDTLRVNLERLRWLPDDLGHRHVRVNIAGFSVQAVDQGNVVRTHNAIVGKAYRKTPVFSDKIQYVVLNPWWETPNSIAVRDKLPAFRRDPSSVQRLGFQVLDRSGAIIDAATIDWNNVPASGFPYRIRQRPGDTNALGQVKIMFPNVHNVYLHDTPNRDLFAKRQRAFSSGCIRTQDPLDLTDWLLQDAEGWDKSAIDKVIATKAERRVNLATPVPVHVLYQTAVADEFDVRFLDDIYDRDARVLAGLKLTPE